MVVDCHQLDCVVCLVTEKNLIFFQSLNIQHNKRLGIFFLIGEKGHLISIGAGEEFRPHRTPKIPDNVLN